MASNPIERAKERARDVLSSLNVDGEDIDEDMLDATVGFLAAFDKLDRDHNGSLTKAEFRDAVKRLNPKEDPDKFILMCDLNLDGIITEGEFIRAFVIDKITDKYCTIFKEFDANKDGKIDRKELTAALKKRGYSQERIDNVFKETDVDRSGYISYYEYAISLLKDQI